jgi:XTP/dITP diphosphohydrolase
MAEFKEEVKSQNKLKMESEFGDVMFAMVNYARYLNIDPDTCLENTNQKFIRRFQHIEKKAKENNKELSEMTLGEMDKYWEEAKRLE